MHRKVIAVHHEFKNSTTQLFVCDGFVWQLSRDPAAQSARGIWAVVVYVTHFMYTIITTI